MEHILFQFSRATAIWSLAGLHLGIAQVEDPTQALLELLQHNTGGDVSRAARIRVAYMALYIWLARNSLILDSR